MMLAGLASVLDAAISFPLDAAFPRKPHDSTDGRRLGGAGFEPAKAVPPDLQSGPFGRLGIHPGRTSVHGTGAFPRSCRDWFGRVRRSSCGNGRAGGESRTHNRRFTKPVLCRLSYASDHKAVKFPTIPPRASVARALCVQRRKITPRGAYGDDTPCPPSVRHREATAEEPRRRHVLIVACPPPARQGTPGELGAAVAEQTHPMDQSIGTSSFSSMAILRSFSWARDSICRTRSLVMPSSRPSCSRVCSPAPLIP